MGVAIKDEMREANKTKVMKMGDETASSTSSRTSNKAAHLRETWTGRFDFLLCCVGYSVGLGNIWRFPYLCYRNGGAVFLIPYLTFLCLCGVPLFFMEVSYGQFASLSPIAVWRLSPLFKGCGYGMVIISGIVCIYYNIIITWTLYYLFHSFSWVLPWSTCDNPWNTPLCATATPNATSGNASSYLNVSNYVTHSTLNVGYNISHNESVNAAAVKRTTPSEEYWQNHVLQISKGIEDMGSVRLELLGCLALAWICVFLCLFKGVKSTGKVVYVTATFPYLVLIILLIRGLTLPGALEGIKFYVIPRWSKLLSLKVWGEAAMQIFYSIGASWGALITMASYNKFNNDCYRDSKIVPVLNCGTSIFAGFVIFSIIGFMAHETGSDIEDVVTQGPGLVFVVYPAAVSRMPVAPLWAVLFFLMLFMIGLDSQFGMLETLTSAFVDEFPHLFRKRKVLFTALMCVIEFLLGIPCVTQGGIYFLQIMDWYSAVFSLMIISLCESLVIAWIYGVERFYLDIQLMIGYRPCAWWKVCWCVITPVTTAFVLVFSIAIHTPVTYGSYSYPGWAIGIGWIFALCSIVPLPVVAIVYISMTDGTLKQRIKKLVHHTPNWGPALDRHRQLYLKSLSTGVHEESYESHEEKGLNISSDQIPHGEIQVVTGC